jgi:protein-tyrosine phosphatase
VIRNVLFVCIGNICRSPMAEALFAQAMPRHMVCSAGLSAVVGEGADPVAMALMRERGLDISGHRAQQMASWMVREADLILTMDGAQQRFIEQSWPTVRGKVRRLLESPTGDIPDPYRQGRRAFNHALTMIEDGVGEVLNHLAQREGRSAYDHDSLQEPLVIRPWSDLPRPLPLST